MADKFQFYNCRVRLAGSLLNEVPKTGISAAEVHLLADQHGEDAIVDISVASDKDVPPVPKTVAEDAGVLPEKAEWNDKTIRAHLERIYDRKAPNTVRVLGNSLTPLPRFLNLDERQSPADEAPDVAKLTAEIEAKVRAEIAAESAAKEPDTKAPDTKAPDTKSHRDALEALG